MSEMRLSDKGIAHLRKEEGSSLVAYPDAGRWSIGVGHYGNINGVPITKGTKITKEQEEQLLRQDIARFENAVNKSVKVPLSQHQFDALVGLAYNIGDGAFMNSTLVKKLNAGDIQGASEQFMLWRKSEGEDSQTLINRRNREREMFLGVGEGQAPNIAMPTKYDDHYYDVTPTQPLQPNNLIPQPELPTIKPLSSFTDNFNKVNNTDEEIIVEPPKPKQKYQKQLAAAFGVEPEPDNIVPGFDVISDLMKSIWDNTA